MVRFALSGFCGILLLAAMSGCAQMRTPGRVVATPLTVVRDVVDAPLVTLANLSETGARKTKPDSLMPSAGVGYGLGGPTAGISLNVTYYFLKGVSYLFGGVDYIIARSLYPNFPEGISPWKEKEEPWGSLYFPNTNALWAEPGAMDESARDEP